MYSGWTIRKRLHLHPGSFAQHHYWLLEDGVGTKCQDNHYGDTTETQGCSKKERLLFAFSHFCSSETNKRGLSKSGPAQKGFPYFYLCRCCVKSIGLWTKAQFTTDWSKWQQLRANKVQIILSPPLTSDRWEKNTSSTFGSFKLLPLTSVCTDRTSNQSKETLWFGWSKVLLCVSERLSNRQDNHPLLLPLLARPGCS